jgi:hypothetical protein
VHGFGACPRRCRVLRLCPPSVVSRRGERATGQWPAINEVGRVPPPHQTRELLTSSCDGGGGVGRVGGACGSATSSQARGNMQPTRSPHTLPSSCPLRYTRSASRSHCRLADADECWAMTDGLCASLPEAAWPARWLYCLSGAVG